MLTNLFRRSLNTYAWFKPTLLWAGLLVTAMPVGHAQQRAKGNADYIDQRIKQSEISPITIIDANGDRSKLPQYTLDHRDFPDKPVLFLCFGGDEKNFDVLKEIANSSVVDHYDVIGVFVTDIKETNFITQSMAQISNILLDKKKIPLVSADAAMMHRMFYTSQYPVCIFSDRNLKLIGYSKSNNGTAIGKTLDGIAAGTVTRSNQWISERGDIVAAGSPDAKYKITVNLSANHIVVKTVNTAGKVLQISNYISSGYTYPVDGLYDDHYDSGQKRIHGIYKNGAVAETVTEWFENGKIKSVTPVNGIYKEYDESGAQTGSGKMVNGLAEGTFIFKKNGNLLRENTFVKGEGNGIQKIYDDKGKLSYQYYLSANYETMGILNDGLEPIKVNDLYGFADETGAITIQPRYKGANGFSDGLAKVVLTDLPMYIDKKGNKVPADEAEIYQENPYRSNITIYEDKESIVKFLQDTFIALNKDMDLNEPEITDTGILSENGQGSKTMLNFKDISTVHFHPQTSTRKPYIEFTGIFEQKPEWLSSARNMETQHIFVLSTSVTNLTGYNIKENFEKLALLNNARLDRKLIVPGSESTVAGTLSQIKPYVEAVNGSTFDGGAKQFTAVTFTPDRYSYDSKSTKDGKADDTVTEADIKWENLKDITVEPDNAEAYALVLKFDDKRQFRLYVKKHYERNVVEMLYRLKAIYVH